MITCIPVEERHFEIGHFRNFGLPWPWVDRDLGSGSRSYCRASVIKYELYCAKFHKDRMTFTKFVCQRLNTSLKVMWRRTRTN